MIKLRTDLRVGLSGGLPFFPEAVVGLDRGIGEFGKLGSVEVDQGLSRGLGQVQAFEKFLCRLEGFGFDLHAFREFEIVIFLRRRSGFGFGCEEGFRSRGRSRGRIS